MKQNLNAPGTPFYNSTFLEEGRALAATNWYDANPTLQVWHTPTLKDMAAQEARKERKWQN